MTDDELVALIQSAQPDELTLAQIEELRRRLPQSPVLRAALAGRLDVERYLVAALAPWQPVAAAIADRAPPAAALEPNRLLPALLVVACSSLVAFVGVVLVVAAIVPRRPEQAATPPAQPPAKSLADAAQPHRADVVAAAEQSAAPGADAAAAPALPPAPSDDWPPASAPAIAAAPVPAAPPAPVEPWQRDGPPERLPVSPVAAFEQPTARVAPPSLDDLKGWLAEVPGHARNLAHADRDGLRLVQFEGLARLRSPWPPGIALRLCLYDYHSLKLHFWNGRQGVTLQFYEYANDSWAAYLTERPGDEPKPKSWSLAATDLGVHWRTNPIGPTAFEIRLADGQLTLSRGDLPIVAAPFPGEPTDVYWEGRALVRQIALVRAAPLAPARDSRPVAFSAPEPARLDGWLGQLPAGARFDRLDDGTAALAVEKIERPAWVAQPLPRTGLCEWLVQLQDPQPGTGVYLGDEAGEPKYVLGIFRERQTGQMAFGWLQPGDGRLDAQHDLVNAPHPFLGQLPWIKLIAAGGALKCEVGVDGQHWGRGVEPWSNLPGGCQTIGLYCPPRAEPRTIKLRRLEFRVLSGLNELAAGEVCQQAVAAWQSADWKSWNDAVTALRPPQLAAGAWRRACALRTLAAGTSPSLSAVLVERLLATALRHAARPAEQLRLLDEAAELMPTWDDAQAARNAALAYEQLGRRRWQQGETRPYQLIAQAQMTAPIWCRHRFQFQPQWLMRAELFELAYAGRWAELDEHCRRVRFWTRQPHPQGPALVDWGLGLAARAVPRPADGPPALLPPEWRGPLSVDLGKEGYNLLAEIEAALAGAAYDDACQIISAADAPAAAGLLPDQRDPQLSLSLPVALELAMREHPPLATTMLEKFAARGRLRVRAAISEGDAEAIAAIPLQFVGTEAAAEARLWLGDRALAAGQFAVALAHYRQAQATAGPALADRLAAGEQLACALVGQQAPRRPAGPVQFGDTALTAAEFGQLVDGLYARRSAGALALAPIDNLATTLPAPSGFATAARARLEGEVGDGAQNVPGELQQLGIDWMARQCALSVHAGRLYACNRFQAAAYDLSNGQLLWRAGVGGEQGYTHDWPLMPMRPLVTNQLVFVRRLLKPGPVLAALAAGDGRLVWQTRPEADRSIVSDAALLQDQLVALAVVRGEQESRLLWLQLDPLTGNVLAERPLARLRESWWQQRSCQVQPLADGLLVACGGAVLRADLSGELRWARQQVWIPPLLERTWLAQCQLPPLVLDDSAIVVQPGVQAVTALRLDCGRLVWQRVLPGVQQLWGATDRHVVVQTDEGLWALSHATGEPAWRYDAQDLLAVQAVGGDAVLLARTERSPQNSQLRVWLVWLDDQSGQPRARTELAALSHEQPRLGPLFGGGGKWWAFSGRGLGEATRELVELTPSGAAEAIPPAAAPAD